MRITLTQVMVAVTLCSVTLAHTVRSQSLDTVFVNVELQNESLRDLFKKIEAQSSLRFVFVSSLVDPYTNLNLDLEKRTVKATLDLVFADTELAYRESDGNVIVFAQTSSLQSELPLLVEVSGTIRDSNGAGMPGVNIIVKGTNKGTSSDANGKFSVNVESDATLIFSFIGYKTIEVEVGNQTVIDVVMEDDITTLEAVVVNGGYYETTRATSTGNIEHATSKDISRQPVVNVLQALQGKMTGVEIVQPNGVPGVGMRIQIRGKNSLNANGNFPLYIIDGVPISSQPVRSDGGLYGSSDPLNTINPENIETIDILKDADATAIYGSLGANGVVLITTKKAKNQDGKTTLDVSYYTGFGRAPQLEMMNTRQYLQMRNEAFRNDNITKTLANATDLLAWDTTRYTNWQDKLIGETARTNDAQLAFSGGNATTSFRFSLGYHSETMVFPGEFLYQRVAGSFNTNYRSRNNKFKTSVTINYGTDDNKVAEAGYLMFSALRLAPVAPKLYNSDGSLNWELDANGFSTWDNPMAELRRKQHIQSFSMISNAVLEYEILSGLSVKTSMGYTRMYVDDIRITPMTSRDPTGPLYNSQSRITGVRDTRNISWIAEPQIVYKKTIAKGWLDAVVGASWQSREAAQLAVSGYGYASDDLLGSLAGATTIFRELDSRTQYRYQAWFGRISYTWNEKYIVNLTGRRDGSSRFGADRKYANFGAAGLGWVFSNEGFVKDHLKFLNFGKIRASYGITGSDAIGDYQFLETYTTTTDAYQGTTGLLPSGLANPSLQWESVQKLELGTELGFLQDRINFSFSWYRNQSSNQLVNRPLSEVTGFPSMPSNFEATVRNTGTEFILRTININSDKVRWSTSFNLTIPRSKLVSFPGLSEAPPEYRSRYKVGEPLDIAFLQHYTGINPQTGLYQFEDANGDGFIRENDRTTVVRTGRKWYGGIGNTVSYKGWELTLQFEVVKQKGAGLVFIGGVPPGSFRTKGGGINQAGNQPVDLLDRWQTEGDDAAYQRYTTALGNASYTNLLNSDRMYEVDASFIRMKTISLGYEVPRKWIEKLRLQHCRIFAQGQNLLTISRYGGADPQNPGFATTLPALKVISGGVQLTF